MDPHSFEIWLNEKDPEKQIAISIQISRSAGEIIKRWASENSMADKSFAVDLLPEILVDLLDDECDEHFERIDAFDRAVSSIFSAIHGVPHPTPPVFRGVDAFLSIGTGAVLPCNQTAAHAAQAFSNIFAVAGGYGWALHYENGDKDCIADAKKDCSKWIVSAIEHLASATTSEFIDLANIAKVATLNGGSSG